ncbi:MAG TPA: flagellar biosynthetic protein FliO [Herbaspirillum sp.]|jgi:flagellar protein FliO/FliZ
MSRPGLASLTNAALLCAAALPTLALALDTPAAAPAKSAATVNSPHLINAAAAVPAASSAGSSTMTMLFGLLLVLGLIICIAWLLKRSGLTPSMQASAAARVVGGVSVGNRERVVVVEIADQWIVVGVAPGRVNALATMPKQESPPATLAENAAPARNFASWMKQTIEKRNAPR